MMRLMMVMMMILIRKEANELCSKFGSDVFMAGEINSKQDFDVYYEVMMMTMKMAIVMMMMVMITIAGEINRNKNSG